MHITVIGPPRIGTNVFRASSAAARRDTNPKGLPLETRSPTVIVLIEPIPSLYIKILANNKTGTLSTHKNRLRRENINE